MSKETEMIAVFHFHASAVSDQSVVPVHDPQGSFSVFRTVDEEHGRGDFFCFFRKILPHDAYKYFFHYALSVAVIVASGEFRVHARFTADLESFLLQPSDKAFFLSPAPPASTIFPTLSGISAASARAILPPKECATISVFLRPAESQKRASAEAYS